MNYWKGLMLAAAIDAVWIMGCPILASEPESATVVTDTVSERVVVRTDDKLTARILEASRLEDSLMLHLQQHSEDVTPMEKLAHVYMDNEWHESAIGPLARALQLDPSRRSLWVALDRAVELSGRGTITDAELTRKALEFKETVSMWGHGC
jgi:cytochrome c-type biogenesis protein CcmH/NrfG